MNSHSMQIWVTVEVCKGFIRQAISRKIILHSQVSCHVSGGVVGRLSLCSIAKKNSLSFPLACMGIQKAKLEGERREDKLFMS